MRVLALLLAVLSFHAAAQTPVQQIQGASPQLVAFAGSGANLQALANGLTLGQPVTLVTQSSDGLLQIVTFTPPNALSASDTARALEQARTALIARGISQPSAQQIGAALMGGSIITSAGQVAVPGVLTGSIPANALQVRNEFAGGVGGAIPLGGSVANFQALNTGLRQGTPITLTGIVNGIQQSVTFTPNTGPLTADQVNLALQLASQTLASVGITNPTPEQIRAALVGGAIQVSGGNLTLQGALQNRTATTSASGPVNTSNSTVLGTSNSPTVAGPIISSPPGISSGAGATAAPIVGTGNTGAPIVGGNPTPAIGANSPATQGVPRVAGPGR